MGSRFSRYAFSIKRITLVQSVIVFVLWFGLPEQGFQMELGWLYSGLLKPLVDQFFYMRAISMLILPFSMFGTVGAWLGLLEA